MVVRIKTNFAGEVMLEMESPTLQSVLLKLSEKLGPSICSPENGDIVGDFKVYLNGVEFDNVADGNNAVLKEKDEVEVTMVIIGGG